MPDRTERWPAAATRSNRRTTRSLPSVSPEFSPPRTLVLVPSSQTATQTSASSGAVAVTVTAAFDHAAVAGSRAGRVARWTAWVTLTAFDPTTPLAPPITSSGV